MATPAGAGAELSIQMLPAPVGEPERGESVAAKLERRLNRFVRFVAFGEWAGNAFGALAFVWATGVLLGGFCTSLKPADFWFATVMIFIEAFRILSRGYRLDNQSLFGTTTALKWISSSFIRMLWRPQEGDEVVLVIGLWCNLLPQLPMKKNPIPDIVTVALLILVSRRPRRPGRLQIIALLTAYLAVVTYTLRIFMSNKKSETRLSIELVSWPDANLLPDAIEFVSVLLLVLRPLKIPILTGTRCCSILLWLGKVISVAWLASGLVMNMWSSLLEPAEIDYIYGTSFASMVFPYFYLFEFLDPSLSPAATSGLSFIIMLVLLLVGNLQIPAAVVQIVLSSSRIHQLLTRHDYFPLSKDSSENMVPAIEVFYVLALCQGSLYIMASILGVFSFFPRRSFVRQSNLCGRRGAKAIDLYYKRAYATCMDNDSGLLAARKRVSLASFATESLTSSNSKEEQLAGVLLLDNLILQGINTSKELESRIIRSSKALSILIGMLGLSDERDRDIRLFAARITAKFADNIRIAGIPGTVRLVSSLLDYENQPARQQGSLLNREQVVADSATVASHIINRESLVANNEALGQKEPPAQTSSGTRGCSWVRRCWQQVKERWSIQEEPPLSPQLRPYQDSFPVLSMVILEKLACDLDNCAEMLKVSDFISKITGLISYTADTDSNSYNLRNAVICSSLRLVRRLASTSGKIGAALRQELWERPVLLDNLEGVFEDSHGTSEQRTLAMDIIAKLTLHGDARQEIGNKQVVITKLIHEFLGRDEPNNQSLRMVAGEALVNLTMGSTANCSAILENQECNLVKGLKDMIWGAHRIYICVAASLLENLCAHSREKLMSHPGASEDLRSSLPAVMENIISTEGKQLETLIGLMSQICKIPECFVFELQSQTNEVGRLVKKLVGTLKSVRKPSPEYPRMRRVIVEMVISFVTRYPGYRTMLRDEGMTEALSEVARTPSNVEKYRVFSGDDGVVVETGVPLGNLVDRAKRLIGTATQTPKLY